MRTVPIHCRRGNLFSVSDSAPESETIVFVILRLLWTPARLAAVRAREPTPYSRNVLDTSHSNTIWQNLRNCLTQLDRALRIRRYQLRANCRARRNSEVYGDGNDLRHASRASTPSCLEVSWLWVLGAKCAPTHLPRPQSCNSKTSCQTTSSFALTRSMIRRVKVWIVLKPDDAQSQSIKSN